MTKRTKIVTLDTPPSPGDFMAMEVYLRTGDVDLPAGWVETAREPTLDVERLADAHWLLVNEVNRTDEAYLAVLDWIEPLVTHDASERADERMAVHDRLAPSRSRD